MFKRKWKTLPKGYEIVSVYRRGVPIYGLYFGNTLVDTSSPFLTTSKTCIRTLKKVAYVHNKENISAH